MNKPSKILPPGSVIASRELSDGDTIASIPENCQYCISADYNWESTTYYLQTITLAPVDNPKYEEELKEYNKQQEVIKKQQQKTEKQERETYERLKKKFEGA